MIDLETAGEGPHDVCEVGWQDVAIGADGRWELTEERGAHLVSPGRPISPDTMAVHHIRDGDVAGAPFWKEIAPSVLRPAFEQRFCRPGLSGGAQWICTWKCALRLWPDLPRFSNQMLRYLRRPAGLVHEVGLPAHRAMPDAYVTAHHLRDMLNEASLAQLLAWSSEPGLLPRVLAGPDRGKSWNLVSAVSLRELAASRDADLRFTALTELRRREADFSEPTVPAQAKLL
ncbi:exodeoxyribonuclease X [Bosea sp. BE271]|uniref:DNA polymerase III subunit epsilon n=1 Tax=Bosea TaxID=85413 RepID=UPI00285B44F6|nr:MULTISPECIES: DNA polymerase III subunit epsilon [Bosea]MDR6830983.1 exodeoxyribonuclease X [Bosea robiniae]MDR6897358.1 exodeoxyribonuclease X [Bosea sp. BE109]MDR7140755.1 exodeoxyribonuclease X [Bosea sp. BE168]MDR7177847.1 exodeoxyribonuclease X [Bosea sp. BE271]